MATRRSADAKATQPASSSATSASPHKSQSVLLTELFDALCHSIPSLSAIMPSQPAQATRPATAAAGSSSASSSSLSTNKTASALAAAPSTGPALSKSQIKRRRRKAAAQLYADEAAANSTHGDRRSGKDAVQAATDDGQRNQSRTTASSSAVTAPSFSSGIQLSWGDEDAQQLFVAAQRLIRGALSFAEAEMHCFDPARTAQAKGRMQELEAAKAELRSIPMLPVADQTHQRAVKQAQIEELTKWIKLHGGYPAHALASIDLARTVAEHPADLSSILALGGLCYHLIGIGSAISHQPLPAHQREVFRSWLLRVDVLFTRLCTAVPRMQLCSDQSQRLSLLALKTGALQLIPVLMRGELECDLNLWTIGNNPFLTSFCHDLEHAVCLEPYLRLFEFGLDPTRIKDGGNPQSALQLARNFMHDHPPAPQAFDPMAAMKAAVAEDIVSDKLNGDWSVLAARATYHHGSLGSRETQRRIDLHAQFMHALVSAWLAHSSKIRALLLKAAPTRLIPPLVDVVSRYLDLEGVPPERLAPAAELD